MNVNEQHRVVKESLSKFIRKNIPGANLKNVDQIVLEYVISILEEASQDESFDVEAFQEMIFETLRLTDMIPEEKLRGRQLNTSNTSNESVENNSHVRRIQHLSETSDGSGSTDSSNCDLFLEECDRLQEMFPESTSMEIKYCMTIANGDVERARQIVIHRQESGQSFHNTPRTNMNKHSNKVVDEKELKNRIIERYSYVDQNDTREYRPVIPKVEPKKLIRLS
ncbi:hypothetical protein PVAND_010515 [Polypedilum vanderplanki]|uniref:CUE domain-containing protein n=1 Tax=Polypedilum vanderplanki TaxID=319348 RepID=A0A9J6CFT1_POLVA|nr:hypothetical protein PVAND_010515 [Polypedilum vanderplanki]